MTLCRRSFQIAVGATGTFCAREKQERGAMHGRNRDADAAELRHLVVVAVLNNPEGWHRRAALFRKFLEHMRGLGARVLVVECVYGDQRHVVATDAQDPLHVRVRCHSELWVKEALINVGIGRLPEDAKYVAWIDADVTFTRPDVLLETVAKLQTHDVVQMWRHCADLGPDGEIMTTHESFAHGRCEGQRAARYGYQSTTMHTGYAWAARLSALEALGGLFDQAILGSGDSVVANAIVGNVGAAVPRGSSAGYMRAALEYQRRCAAHVRGNLGCVAGTILHAYHGDKKARQYGSRSDILVVNGFDPTTDIRKNLHGVWEFVYDLPSRRVAVERMRDAIRLYNRTRNEDATTRDRA
jgi:hypothetical protein